MPITYTIISEGCKDKTITIDDNTTVKEAIEMINLCLGEDDEENEVPIEQEIIAENPGVYHARVVRFENTLDDSYEDSQNNETKEPVEIFGLSAYIDRSIKFNTIKFPKNELIVYPVSLDNLFIRSTAAVHANPKK